MHSTHFITNLNDDSITSQSLWKTEWKWKKKACNILVVLWKQFSWDGFFHVSYCQIWTSLNQSWVSDSDHGELDTSYLLVNWCSILKGTLTISKFKVHILSTLRFHCLQFIRACNCKMYANTCKNIGYSIVCDRKLETSLIDV